MTTVSFFTPIVYGDGPKSISKSILQTVDNYFYLGGKKACVIAGRIENGKEVVLLSQGKLPYLLTALKIASYLTLIFPLIALIAKAVFRYTHQFHLIDPKAELEKNMVIEPALVKKIEQLMPEILERKDTPEIEWLSKRDTAVFRLRQASHLVFKMHTVENVQVCVDGKWLNGEQQIRNRFENMIKAKKICLVDQLDLLTIPQAKMFEVNAGGKTLPIIAEQSFDILATDSAQEELYRACKQGLGQTVRQLVTFIAKTGFNDVIWRNIPLQDEASQFKGPRRIALIDLDCMGDAKAGILGSYNGSCGLVRCLFSEEQIDTVLAEAQQKKIITQQEAQKVKARRLEEIRSNQELLAFYQRNGILNHHRKPLEVDVNALGLDLNEQGQVRIIDGGPRSQRRFQPVTMRQVVEGTVAEINRLIQEKPDRESVKGKRSILLNTNHDILRPYDLLKDDQNKSWLHKVIDALVAKGYLFKLEETNGHGYFVQA